MLANGQRRVRVSRQVILLKQGSLDGCLAFVVLSRKTNFKMRMDYFILEIAS